MNAMTRKARAPARRRAWPPLRRALAALCAIGLPGACDAAPPGAAASSATAATAPIRQENSRLWMTVGGRRFAVTLADTDAARAFAARLPLAFDMGDLNGNEKHAELPQALPAAASRPGAIHAGDVMLYGSKTLVVFYESFASPYSYTRLGRVDAPAGLAGAIGPGSARFEFSKD